MKKTDKDYVFNSIIYNGEVWPKYFVEGLDGRTNE
jgi:hypothetical protein